MHGRGVRLHRRAGILASVVLALATGCGGGSSGRPSSGNVQSWAQKERLPSSALPGARVFAAAGCTACHTYAGSGTEVLHAPDLTAIGSRHLGVPLEIRHLRCPACVNPGSSMPGYSRLGGEQLRQLAVFLEASRGIR